MRPAEDRRVGLLYVATVSATVRQFLVPLAAHFRALGWRVSAAAAGVADDPTLQGSFDELHELPLSRSIRDLMGMLRSERALAGLVGSGSGFDIVHAHTPIAGFVARAAVRGVPSAARPAVAYTAHGFHFHEGGSLVTNTVFLTAERIAGRWTDRLVVINAEDQAAAQRHRIVPSRRLVRMPGIGVDTGWYSRSRMRDKAIRRMKTRYGLQQDAPLFVVVGELNRNKRQADVISALALARHRDAQLLLLGDGPARMSLEAQIERLGLGHRVRIAGFVEDIRPAVSAATALILASSREGLPRSIMEAFSLEVPVVASAARGSVELVDGDGRTVAVGDVSGFARAMDWVLEHPDDARAMGSRGRVRMIANYDLGVVIARHEDMYERMLAERSVRNT